MKLGRFPFAASVAYHMSKRYGIVNESTYKEEERKLRYLERVFEGLREEDLIVSTDPRHFKAKEIQEFMAWMKRNVHGKDHNKALDPYTQAKYLQHLKNLLKTMKNHVLDDMKADGVRFPKNPRKPIRTISGDGLETIFDTLDTMKGWGGSVSRGVCALAFATGIRPKELRLAEIADLDMPRQRFFVRHPKGEGSWASSEWVDIIRPDMIPMLDRYVRERKEYLAGKGYRNARALFPNLTKGQDGFYSANHINQLKAKIEKLSGIDFRIKDFRSTLTTITCTRDPSLLPAMSAQLRHTDLKTTQRYYAATERAVAGKQLKDSYKESDSIKTQRPVIESKKYMSGYA